jgi:hypothetical protein
MTLALSPSAELLLLEQPQFPSARLLHTLRWVMARYGLDCVVWPEEDAFVAVHTTPDVLTGRLVHVPHGLFPDGSQLREQLRVAGVRWNYLPPVPDWSVVLHQAAFLAWLAHGTPQPWRPQPRAARFRRIPTIPAAEVPRWH